MRTTINIPEPLYRRAEIRAAERAESVEQLVIESLERVLDEPAQAPAGASSPGFTLDEFGFPVLTGREGLAVTDELVTRIREEEGL